MKRYAIFALCLVLASAIVWGVGYEKGLERPPGPQQEALRSDYKPDELSKGELLRLVNVERDKYGAPALQENLLLDQSAQLKAADEFDNHYFGHVNPSTGKHGYEYIAESGMECINSGENITENIYVNDSRHAVNAWIASPPHHAAMIDSRFTLTGFGIQGNQLVEHFCQPE